jgi:uncharacterized membrane protein (DUF485 family)
MKDAEREKEGRSRVYIRESVQRCSFIIPVMEVNMSEFASSGEGSRSVSSNTPVTDAKKTGGIDWRAIEEDGDFRKLVREKRNFIIPATIFFLVYYFGFLILVGYFPEVVDVNVIGNINIAYLFALSQFFMAWILMYLYVRRAGTFDRLAGRILQKVKGGNL